MPNPPFNPNWAYGYVPSPEEWNGDWAKKADYSSIQGQTTPFDGYGAVGNGTADDTAALNAAIADAATKGLRLHLPAGFTFLISGPLTVPANSYLQIDGTIFKAALAIGAAQFSMLLLTGNNITIDLYGVIDGNTAAQVITTIAAAGIVTWYGNNQYQPGSGQILFSNILIRGAGTIQNTSNWPVSLAMQNSIVSGITMTGAGSSPQLIDSLYSGFQNCIAHDIRDDGLGLYSGNVGCFVDGCTVYNCATGPFILSDFAATSQNSNCRLTNNTVYNNTNTGIFVYGLTTALANGITIAGNACWNNGPSNQIGNLDVGNVVNLVVTANTFLLSTGSGGFAGKLSGIIQGATVSRNIFQGNGGICLVVAQDNAGNKRLVISDNLFLDNAGQGGIQLNCVASSGYITLRNNDFQGTITNPISDISATHAAVIEGVNTTADGAPQKILTQSLLMRPFGASSGGIILASSGDANFGGDVTVQSLTVTGTETTGGEIVTGSLSAANANITGTAIIAGTSDTLGFYGVEGVTKQTLTGSRGSATVSVLQQVCALLNALGIATDSTTA
jgi:hypothetical protein